MLVYMLIYVDLYEGMLMQVSLEVVLIYVMFMYQGFNVCAFATQGLNCPSMLSCVSLCQIALICIVR